MDERITIRIQVYYLKREHISLDNYVSGVIAVLSPSRAPFSTL